jgi:hypothetical protein
MVIEVSSEQVLLNFGLILLELELELEKVFYKKEGMEKVYN